MMDEVEKRLRHRLKSLRNMLIKDHDQVTSNPQYL